jgi:hypothetical protein
VFPCRRRPNGVKPSRVNRPYFGDNLQMLHDRHVFPDESVALI